MKASSYYKKIAILSLLLGISCILGICIGPVTIKLSDVISAILNRNPDVTITRIIRTIRIPRVISAVFTGIGLSLSGVLLQIVMNNSLAAPNIIGVNAGAGLGVLLILVFFPGHIAFIPWVAFIGALITSLLIYLIAYKTRVSKTTVVLAGIAITSLWNSIMNSIVLFYPNLSIDVSSFMFGSLSNIRSDRLWWPILYICVVFVLVLVLKNALNVLLLGDALATSLGLNINGYRFLFIILASTLAGSVVSFAGLIGFVGLVVPHIGRKIVGNDCRMLLPFSSLLGAFLVVISDLLGTILFRPYEIPVGIILSFLGSPYFIYLLLRKKGGETDA